MRIQLPELSLVVLIGASGSGKSTFAAKHFRPTELLSSDFFRGLVADDPNDQGATKDAFDALHFIAASVSRRGASRSSTRRTCSRMRAGRSSSWPASST